MNSIIYSRKIDKIHSLLFMIRHEQLNYNALKENINKLEIETKTDNEVIKGCENENNLNIHLETHRANLQHERKLIKDNHEHEMAKTKIILPIW